MVNRLALHFFCLLTCAALSTQPSYLNGDLPILFDSSNHLHRSRTYHPEQPARIEACVKILKGEAGVELMDGATERPSETEECWWAGTKYEPFSLVELERARSTLLKIHSPEVVSDLETKCRDSRQRRIQEGKNPLGFVGYIDDDTYVTTETYDVCLRATASWMRCIDWIHSGKTTAAMALTRPPGHHSTTKLSNGFCIFNFAASAAIHFQALQPDSKISILDWDVHYGQGVADIVAPLSSIRYASIHQVPAFPYLGTKKGVQHERILTIPMTAETTWTCGYRQYLEEALDFLFADDWQPDLVIVCAGYDALDSDELASVSLNALDYARMTEALMGKIKSSSKPAGLLLGLEGGYQLNEMAGGGNLQQAVLATVKALLEA